MKNMTLGQKMRWVAGGLYVLLFLYQVFTQRLALMQGGVTTLPLGWLASIMLVPMAAVMAVWMFSSKEVLSANAQRAVVVGTLLVVCFELLTYQLQVDAINATLYEYWNAVADKPIWQYFFMIFRLLLLILAAFFVTSSKNDLDKEKDSLDENDDPEVISAEVLEVMEELEALDGGSESTSEGEESDAPEEKEEENNEK